MSRLVDDALSTSTLGNVLSTNISTKDLYGTFARTHTGSLLRKLSSLNVSALQQAVAGTKTTFKSGTWSPCTAGFYEVAALLVEEYRRGPAGCMAPNTARCDFSLPVFTRDVADKLTSYISTTDDSKDLCVTYLGNDFVNGAAQVPPASRTDLVTFESFFRTQRDAIQQILRDTPTSSELPNAIGDRRGGGSIFGDASRFAASYSYEAEWGVNVIQWKDVAKTKPCRLGGQIEGRLDAGVTLFGVNKNLVDAGLKARTVQTDASLSAADKVASFDAHVELLGIDIFTIDDEPLPTSYSKENEDSFDISLVRTTVLLGFIPVTIAAGFGFDYGYRLNAAFTQSSCIDSPSLKMSADVRPHAGADAYVEAYVDLFIAGAGVKGELTLLDAALPFDASVAVIQQPTGWAVDASSSLVLELTELSGAISFVVKVIGITVWETELFSWAGIRQRVPLWETDVTFPLIGFDILY